MDFGSRGSIRITTNVQGRIEFYIADFYCPEKRLIVELDGAVHDDQADYDEQRDATLAEKGLRVLRISNREMLNPSAVLKKIADF